MPLHDIRILDLTRGLSGSLATKYLANYGAEVVKVEPPKGDPTRRYAPIRNGESLYFRYLSAGKKSVLLDYAQPEGAALLRTLLRKADVVCADFRPSEAKALGLDYESLKAEKPDLILASVTPYGLTGPLAEAPASSLTVQARSVAMDMTGMPGGYPVQSGPSIPEHYAAGYLATAVMLALIDREKRGVGQLVDISLQDAMYSCIEAAPVAYSTIGEVQSRKGNDDPSCAPYDTFQTADGYLAVGCAAQDHWERFCDALGFDDLKNDPLCATNDDRVANYASYLRPALAERLLRWEKFDTEKRCCDAKIPCCAVLDVREIVDAENTRVCGFLQQQGDFCFPSMPVILAETPPTYSERVPALGTDNDAILSEGGNDNGNA